ncbi:hypothetical protein DIPPA_01014 [Diplonema papillatum]|nr:hypothetical protein DIPPA_01014 [Diplonema papillatum]
MCGNVDEVRRFIFFAFRQLRRIPAEWQPHYRYELTNQLRQSDFDNHPSPEVTAMPLYWKLNYLKRGYHGVKWVLSRFDLDCPPIPGMFHDERSTIYTNEANARIYERFRSEKLLTADDPYVKARTISEAEALVVGNYAQPQFSRGGGAPESKGPLDKVAVLDQIAPHRLIDPETMTSQDLADDSFESDFGGTFHGDSTGFPAGMSAEEAEKDPTLASWHPNVSVSPNADDLKAFRSSRRQADHRNSTTGGDAGEPWQAHSNLFVDEPEQLPLRWVRNADGKWIRKAQQVRERSAESYHQQPPPGLFGSDY